VIGTWPISRMLSNNRRDSKVFRSSSYNFEFVSGGDVTVDYVSRTNYCMLIDSYCLTFHVSTPRGLYISLLLLLKSSVLYRD
jgi:hypothetical protein